MMIDEMRISRNAGLYRYIFVVLPSASASAVPSLRPAGAPENGVLPFSPTPFPWNWPKRRTLMPAYDTVPMGGDGSAVEQHHPAIPFRGERLCQPLPCGRFGFHAGASTPTQRPWCVCVCVCQCSRLLCGKWRSDRTYEQGSFAILAGYVVDFCSTNHDCWVFCWQERSKVIAATSASIERTVARFKDGVGASLGETQMVSRHRMWTAIWTDQNQLL